jgi:putative ABC transport system permease protein
VAAGFTSKNLLAVRIALPESRYPDGERATAFYESVLERLRSLPGVTAAAAASQLPLTNDDLNCSFVFEGRPQPKLGDYPATQYRTASYDYFRALGIPRKLGRLFEPSDRPGAPRVAIVNETFVRRYFPGESPLGKRVTMDDGSNSPVEIVGVVGDVRHFGLDAEIPAELFVPFPQAVKDYWDWTNRSLAFTLRASGDPSALLPAVRREVSAADPDLPVFDVKTGDQLMADSVSARLATARLLAVFAFTALLLAAIGVYGVISYAVGQRTREFGLRMALGARPRDVVDLVAREGARLTFAGAALGLVAAAALTHLLSRLVFSVSVLDPVTFAAAGLLLAIVSLAAGTIPGLRAMRVDPLEALRDE